MGECTRVIIMLVLAFLIGFLACGFILYIPKSIKEKKTEKLSNKHRSMFITMKRWMLLKLHGKQIADFFVQRGFKKIAIYGMGNIGEVLVEELKGENVTIEYAIDRAENIKNNGIKIFAIEEPLKEVDLIVVTVIGDIEEIFEMLAEKVICPIISIEDIIFTYDTNYTLTSGEKNAIERIMDIR